MSLPFGVWPALHPVPAAHVQRKSADFSVYCASCRAVIHTSGVHGLRQQHRCVPQALVLHCEIQANAVYGFFTG